MRILCRHDARFSFLCISNKLLKSSTKVSPTIDLLHFWNVRFVVFSNISYYLGKCMHTSNLKSRKQKSTSVPTERQIRCNKCTYVSTERVDGLAGLRSNVLQTHLKRMSNVNTSSTRASTHSKNLRDFWKRMISSSRPFAIPLSTQVFLQGCFHQSRVSGLGGRGATRSVYNPPHNSGVFWR